MRGVARARDDQHVGPQLAHDAHDLVDRRLRVDGDDHGRRPHQAAALQEGRVGGVAVVDLAAAPAVGADGRRVVVGGDEGTAVPLQHVADDLADAAVADDDGVPGFAGGRRRGKLRLERLALFQHDARCGARPFASSGISAMVSEVTASMKLETPAARSPSVVARPRATKANSPPGPSSRPVSIAAGQGHAEQAGQADEQGGLDGDQADHRCEEPQRLARQLAHVDAHADGEEEDAEQQALERLDGGLDGLAELGLGQHQAGDEGAERHGQARHAGDDGDADDDEQVAATNSSVACRGRDQAQQRPQQQSADDDDEADGEPQPAPAPAPGRRAPIRPCASPRIEMNSRIGITARSWNSRTEKLVRPAAVVRRRWLDSTSMTIAVEDRARHAPMMTEAAAPLPNSAATPPIMPAESTTCRLPRPNTSRRMVMSRSKESSSPIRKSRKTTPSSAMLGDVFRIDDRDPERKDMSSLKEPSPSGPSIAPAAR